MTAPVFLSLALFFRTEHGVCYGILMFRKVLLLGAVAAATTVLSTGCAYRSDLAQGNFVEQEAVDQLRQGMTAAQVQYVLGTPMLTDPFDNTRWYYVHFLRQGWNAPEIRTLVVQFQGNSLYDMAGDFHKPDAFYSGNMGIQKVDISGAQGVQQGTGGPVYPSTDTQMAQ